MNPLKNLFNKVFDATPPAEPRADASKEDEGFEWNPEEETVAPTVTNAASWKRRGVQDDEPVGAHHDSSVAVSAHSLPAPAFEAHQPSRLVDETMTSGVKPAWNQPESRASLADTQAIAGPVEPEPAVAPPPAPPRLDVSPVPPVESRVRPSAPEPAVRATAAMVVPPHAPAAVSAAAQPALPVSDFEEVYRKASIKSPVHGYGVERVYRLLTSRRLSGLDRNVRRSALLTALDAAGVPVSDVAQDAVLRRKALAAYEAEKALELQSLRSRNESRVEALQDTIETFTRQKQSQIERLAQGSTSAVRTQSDLEIRKRMEQDRLYRSLSYFLEPLPPPTAFPDASAPEHALPELKPPSAESRSFDTIDVTSTAEISRPFGRPLEAHERGDAAAPPPEEAVTLTPPADTEAETGPLATSGLEMALRAAAEEAKTAGWGRPAIAQDASVDAVDALRKLREAQKTGGES